jgi:hypothetical protein
MLYESETHKSLPQNNLDAYAFLLRVQGEKSSCHCKLQADKKLTKKFYLLDFK